MIKGIIFDLDDTLYEEIDFVYSGFHVIAEKISQDFNRDKEKIYNSLVELFSYSNKNVFNRLFEKESIEINESYINQLVEIYHNHFPLIELSHDSKYLLQYLKNHEYKLGLITDGIVNMQKNKIKALKLNDIFDCVIITDEYGIEYRKPHEFPYRKCLRMLNIDARESIYVGDNIQKDFITAKKIGLFTVKIVRENGLYKNIRKDKEYEADYTINSLYEIINIIGRLNK